MYLPGLLAKELVIVGAFYGQKTQNIFMMGKNKLVLFMMLNGHSGINRT